MIAGSPEGLRKRMTQEQRSAITRAKLLDATIECLIKNGYSGTTTSEVAARAGVSRGAQLHHFPAKIELVTGAVEHLAERVIGHLRSQAPQGTAKSDRISAAVNIMWSSFSGPTFYAALELWTAARTDPELHAALYPMERRVGRTIESMCQDLFGDVAYTSQFRDAIRLTLYMMRGMALERVLKDDERQRRTLLEYWKTILSKVLEQTSASADAVDHNVARPAGSSSSGR